MLNIYIIIKERFILTAKKNPTAADLDRLIWCDLEMTGLDAEKERIIEMAVCVTDGNLTQIVQV